MKKVVFLRVERGSPESSCRSHAHQSALVLQKAADGYLNIQGRSPVAWTERQRCWDLFRKSAKSLLGLCEASTVSVCLSDPPHTAINDLVDVFRQPSHIVSLTLSPLATTTDREVQRRKNTSKNCSRQPLSGLNKHSPSPPSTPQAKRRPKMSDREMDRLLSQLDEVSQSLQRTQTHCEAIARRYKGRVTEPSEGTDGSSDDLRVERLLKVAESLTSQIIQNHAPVAATGGATTSQQPVGAGPPDSPTGVCAQPSLSGGTYVLWDPVRLDGRDRNKGCKVTGYAVYVDGIERSKVTNPIGSHVEVMGMASGRQYQIQVSTLSESSESPLSPPLLYRHEAHLPSTVAHHPSSTAPPEPSSPTDMDSRRDQQSAKVKHWLLGSSQTIGTTSPPGINTVREDEGHARFIECHDGEISRSKSDKLQTMTPDSTHLTDDTRSMGSSHTSGIVMDHPPSSPKLTSFPSYQCDAYSLHSETTTLLVHSNRESFVSPCHHHLRLSPSPTSSPWITPSQARSPTPQDHTVDTVIDEPLDFTFSPHKRGENKTTAVSTVHLVARSHQQGPAPPTNIRVRSKQPGYITVSWSPSRRDAKGCSNGCYVLGYRVYVNGASQISVDGPMSYETTIRCPHLDSTHRLAIHVRTRSIAAESEPSSTVIYDVLLHETLEQSLGPKVKSVISSTVTLCPSDKPHPLPLKKPSSSQAPTSSHETYV